MDNMVFVLGAPDPEMREIEAVLSAQGIPFVWATHAGRRVIPGNAYSATGVSATLPRDAKVVMVECEVLGLAYSTLADHHRPGDPGYELPPERFMEGSSLGQVLHLLGITPTREQTIIAAADHCLAKAYEGLCPGVSPAELAAWRQLSRSNNRNVPVEQLLDEIESARQLLESAPTVVIAGAPVVWVADTFSPEMSEASARYNIPYMYRRREMDGRLKAGIMGAPESSIREWMRECGLQDVYGDPVRGYAGGYFQEAA